MNDKLRSANLFRGKKSLQKKTVFFEEKMPENFQN